MTPTLGRRRARAFGTIATLTVASVLTVVGVAAAAALSHSSRHGGPPPRLITMVPATHRTTAPAATPARWVLVSLGDSVPAGSACTCAPFPQVYAQQVATTRDVGVDLRNEAAPGQTSGQLRQQVETSAALRHELATASIVTVTIGANDFGFGTYRPGRCSHLSCYRTGLAQLSDNLDAIFTTLTELTAEHPAAVLVTGYWEVWRDGAVGRRSGPTYMRVGDALTRRVNQVIASRAAAHGLTYVDLYQPFHGPDGDRDDTALLAPDGDHPSRSGHQLISAALLASGLAPLA